MDQVRRPNEGIFGGLSEEVRRRLFHGGGWFREGRHSAEEMFRGCSEDFRRRFGGGRPLEEIVGGLAE